MARQTRRTYASAALATALALTLGACASLGTSGDNGAGDQPDESALPKPTAEAEEAFLLQVSHVGGFVPMGWDFANVPRLTVYPDGLVVMHGPTTMEYPGRALPNLITYQLSDEQLAALVAAAEDAGLLADAPDYGMPPVADAGATVVTFQVDERTYVHQAEALEIMLGDLLGDAGDTGLSAEALAAREALAAFIATAEQSVEGATELGAYKADSYAYMAQEVPPLDEATEVDVMPAVLTWPLTEPLNETACTVVEGDQAQTLGETLEEARQNDRFEQDGTQYEVFVRVLLPGETGCTGTEQLPAQG